VGAIERLEYYGLGLGHLMSMQQKDVSDVSLGHNKQGALNDAHYLPGAAAPCPVVRWRKALPDSSV